MFVTPRDEDARASEAENPDKIARDGEASGKGSSLAADLPDTQDGDAVETTRFQVNVGRDVIRAIKVAAAEDGLRASQVVDTALRAYLNRRPKS
jgi:hypothetical protein